MSQDKSPVVKDLGGESIRPQSPSGVGRVHKASIPLWRPLALPDPQPHHGGFQDQEARVKRFSSDQSGTGFIDKANAGIRTTKVTGTNRPMEDNQKTATPTPKQRFTNDWTDWAPTWLCPGSAGHS